MGFDLTGIGSVASFAKSVVERVFPPKMTDAEKAQAEMQLQEMLQERETQVIDAQKSIMVAEMQQSDAFTKRARPSIVYAGLVFIFLVHVLFPIVSWFSKETLPALVLPEQFWWAWTGVCSVWILGRSAEKRGVQSKLVGMITGGGK